MVVAKPEWFKRDNSTFLNIKMPWQGAVYYTGAAFLLLIGILLPQNLIITITIGVLFMFIILDATYATIKSMDERQNLHYSIAMRNMAWGMIVTMVILSIFISYYSIKDNLGLLIIGTGIVGAIINLLTRYKLERGS